MMQRSCTIQLLRWHICCFFFFNDTATTEIYTLSLHDALPIYNEFKYYARDVGQIDNVPRSASRHKDIEPLVNLTQLSPRALRSEEHTSELQSRQYLVCRLLLEKKKKHNTTTVMLLTLTHPSTI